MSEPVSNAAIEDVLSSIRRLVSEDNRKEQPVADEQPKPAPAPRLVLTPSLRVAETVEEPDENHHEEQSTDAVDPEGPENTETDDPVLSDEMSDGLSDDLSGGDDVTIEPDMSDAVAIDLSFLRDDAASDDAKDRDAEPTKAVDSKWDKLAAMSESDVVNDGAEGDTDQGEEQTEASDAAPWSDPDTTLFKAAKVEVLTNPVHVPEPIAAEEQVSEDIPVDLAEFDASDETSVLDAVAEGGIGTDDVREEEFGEDPEAPLSQTIEALEAVIAESAEQWEPDGDLGDDYAGIPTEPMAWQDVEDEQHESDAVGSITDDGPIVLNAEADVTETASVAEPAPTPIPVRPERVDPSAYSAEHSEDGYDDFDEGDLFAQDENFLDEESLRELVTDIVREELQGALGERITRNVRKLVRREIHRALAAQDLE